MFFLPLSVLSIVNYYLPRFSLSYIFLYSKISRYLLPFSSTSSVVSSSGIYTAFHLFSRSTPPFFIPSSYPISLLNICTVEINPFTSRSLFAKIFNSSINKRWFNFSPFFKVYSDPIFLNTCVRGTIKIANGNGDKLPL